MGWVQTWPIDANSYGALGAGNRGDGERYHRHTIGQSFRALTGLIAVRLDGVDHVLAPGDEELIADSNHWHGLWILVDGSTYESVFFEVDGGPVDVARIRREQVPSINASEAATRRAEMDAAGWPRSLEEVSA